MSDSWVRSNLEAAVGEEMAEQIILEMAINADNVQFTLVRIPDSSGEVIISILDRAGYVKK